MTLRRNLENPYIFAEYGLKSLGLTVMFQMPTISFQPETIVPVKKNKPKKEIIPDSIVASFKILLLKPSKTDRTFSIPLTLTKVATLLKSLHDDLRAGINDQIPLEAKSELEVKPMSTETLKDAIFVVCHQVFNETFSSNKEKYWNKEREVTRRVWDFPIAKNINEVEL